MTAEQLENFHLALLQVLDTNAGSQFGLAVPTLKVFVQTRGFRVVDTEVEAAMNYMTDKEIGFVQTVDKGQFNPAHVCWKITARGINHLRARGL